MFTYGEEPVEAVVEIEQDLELQGPQDIS